MIDLNELMGRITFTAKVANIRIEGKRRFYWRMRLCLALFRLAAWVGGTGFEEVGVDEDELSEE